MQIIEIEPVEDEQKENKWTKGNCWFVERLLFWSLVFLLVVIVCLFCGEVLESMHLQNKIVQHELDKLDHHHYEPYKPISWMP